MYDHRKRYGKRGRSGEVAGPAPRMGFLFGPGRHLRYGEGGLEAVHDSGRVVPLEGAARIVTDCAFHVGDALVFSVQGHAQPWSVVDTTTGELRGALTGQSKDPELDMHYAAFCDPRDNRHIWLAQGATLRSFDVATMTRAAEIPLPGRTKASAFAVGHDGGAAVFLRPADVRNDSSQDELVLLDSGGKLLERAKELGASSGVHRVGKHFVVTEHSAKRFRIFDSRLGDVASVALMPDDDWAKLLPLPSGREWIAIGGHGQWDHYGEAELGPKGASRAIEAPAAKPMTKRTRTKA